MFVENHISSVPIVDDENVVLNVYETVDVMVSMECDKLGGGTIRVNAHSIYFSLQSIAKSGKYNELDVPVGVALEARPDVSILHGQGGGDVLIQGVPLDTIDSYPFFIPQDFPGVHTCTLNDTLYSIFSTIRKRRVYRLIVVDQDNKLKGIVSLSDILRYLIG